MVSLSASVALSHSVTFASCTRITGPNAYQSHLIEACETVLSETASTKQHYKGYDRSKLESGCVQVDILQITSSMERLQDSRLIVENVSVSLDTNLGEVSPSLEVLWAPLVAVSLLGVLPVAFAKVEHCCNLLVLDIVH